MIRYILAGGNDRTTPGYGQVLAKELGKSYERFRLLSCFFSSPEEFWTLNFKKWKPWFEENVGNIESYDFATPDNLTDKAKTADILYFHGGDTELLIRVMGEFSGVQTIFEGKTVIGSSAGANMISANYWSSTHQRAGKGLGLLDVNVMVHYGAPEHNGVKRTEQDWLKEESKFRKVLGDKNEILQLPEGSFRIFEVGN